PGLKMVFPSTPTDAHRMIRGAIADPDPVLFFEQKSLYRTAKEELDESASPLRPGRAKVRREGADLSIVTYGAMVHRAVSAADVVSRRSGIEVDVLDLRSLAPLDEEALLATARKTNRILILHEDNVTGGAGGELAARIAESAFDHLDAPIRRLGALDVPIPYAGALEDASLPSVEKIATAVEDLHRY
ncbi:MAG: alpha-ketoacid dehydrogenase subunit beta, partial [Planctomycetes bacterium]|nr:alpha-ketoacid dehydrogenase subunit beta [Planctomycetota bacterium]